MQQFADRWTYQSFLFSRNVDQSFGLRPFASAQMVFQIQENSLGGKLDMGGNSKLIFSGSIQEFQDGLYEFRWAGKGQEGTGTEGWIYDYHGFLNQNPEESEAQPMVIIGTVIRTTPHDGQPAGVVGTFHLVKMDLK